MNEKIPDIESSAERLPTKEEIKAIFDKLLEGRGYMEKPIEEDERGILLYEIETTVTRKSVEYIVEYSYKRAEYDHKQEKLLREPNTLHLFTHTNMTWMAYPVAAIVCSIIVTEPGYLSNSIVDSGKLIPSLKSMTNYIHQSYATA